MRYVCTLQSATLVWTVSEVKKSCLPLFFFQRVVMTHEIAACCLFV